MLSSHSNFKHITLLEMPKRQTRKKFKNPGPTKCSPLSEKKGNGKTCLPPDVERRITNTVRNKCKKDDGRCIVNNSSLTEDEKQKILKTYFRPKQPTEWKTKPHTWLTNDDIKNVMNQFEDAYTHFKFIGVVPIDFTAPNPYDKSTKKCMNPEFCHINLKDEIAAGKTMLGAVFNLDPHYKGGSHWVGLAIDLKRFKAYYFDSYGVKPPEQVARYMRYLTIQEPKLVLQSNGRRFQYSDTECGVYSMYFLYCMMDGMEFKKFCKNPISDKWMYKFRTVFFDSDAP